METKRNTAIKYMIIASVLWSIGGIFIKLINWNPMAIAGSRSAIAALVMMMYLKKFKFKINKSMLICACSYSLLVILFVSANKLTTSANAILLQFTSPVWVALLSRAILKQKISRIDGITIIFVILGMIMFFIDELEMSYLLGNILAILSGIVMAGMILLFQQQKENSLVEITLLGNVITAIVGIPFYFISSPGMESVLPLFILGVFQLGIPYLLYVLAIPNVTAIDAVLIPVLEPLLNPLWVFIFAKESPTLFSLLGGGLVLLSVTVRGIIMSKKLAQIDSPSL
ncbi:Threonine/homoserine efflux transporter RhtA [Acetoanaerobium noterae]|uniref:Threonine/homoserine efflux transporter RhtA n=1 Tax=Acetoanaerobium noterae TaxID=745369 RepID=A0A1T5CVQ3_9FIRM|nr:DMT family transporter [Acetoanaerobium noterae]SKB63457.1 Threonine/homoserine efflux transporter RhtA [Acetoanaerobium noterae]